MQSSDLPTPFRHPARLIVEQGELRGMLFPLREEIVSIGRGPDNQIQIIDSRISRHHALLLLNEGTWYVRDLESKNGIQVNNIDITTDQMLVTGDRVQIGDALMIFELEHPIEHDTTGNRASGLRLQEDGAVEPSSIVSLVESEFKDELGAVLVGPRQDDPRLAILYEVAELTITVLDQDELLDRLIDLIQRVLTPHRAGILLFDDKFEILLPKVIRRPANSTDDIVISNSIITRAINDRVAVLVSNAPRDQRFQASDSIAVQKIQSAICTPLVYKEQVLGVLYLDRRRPSDGFSPEDLRLVAGIANQAALSIANSRMHRHLLMRHSQERELEIARSIQEKLLPREMPRLDHYEVSGMSRPARMVGGDYFDVITLEDGRLILAVADVSGKGVPAAILLASVRAAVQIEARGLSEGLTLTELVSRVNQMIYRDTSSSMFVTMIMVILDPAAGTFTYCNAGHAPPILIDATGNKILLETGGCLLGVMPGAAYEAAAHPLPPGAMLILYTDGVTDTLDAESALFGEQRLMAVIDRNRHLSAPAMRLAIDEAARTFRGDAEPFDDFTVLVLKATG